MGDALSGIFGGGQRTEGTVEPDPLSRQANFLRLDQLQRLFGNVNYSDFAFPRTGDAYAPAPGVSDLYGTAGISDVSPFVSAAQGQLGTVPDTTNLLSLQDYINRGQQNIDFTQGQLAAIGQDNPFLDTLAGFGSQQNPFIGGLAGLSHLGYDDLARFGQGLGSIANVQRPDFDTISQIGQDYISKIALPQILSTAALQGLEGGGFVPESIARAGAEIALPLSQQLQDFYLQRGQLGVQAALGGQSLAENRTQQLLQALQSGGQLAATQQQQNLQGQLGGGALANEQQQLALQALLGGGQLSQQFTQGLPQASSLFSLLPGQQNLLQGQYINTLTSNLSPFTQRDVGLGQRAATLFPLADYSRALQEQDVLRQQGVVTTGLTGLPFTPGSSTTGRQSSQPLFNFFGQG